MDFKRDFILKTKSIYRETVAEKLAYQKVCDKFESYFKDLKESVQKEIDASDGEFDIRIDKTRLIEVKLNHRKLVIEIEESSVTINVAKLMDEMHGETPINEIITESPSDSFIPLPKHDTKGGHFFQMGLKEQFDPNTDEKNLPFFNEIKNMIDILEYEDGAYRSQVFQSPITRNIIDNYLAIAFREELDNLSSDTL